MNPGPILPIDHWSVLLAEIETGVLLATPGVRSKGGEPMFHVFETRAGAEEWAANVLANHPDVECIVFDSGGMAVKEMRDVERFREYRKRLEPKAKVSLWQRLFARKKPR